MTTINYERRGSGTPLILVHGIASRWEMWLPVIDALAAHHDVIAVDVPGFGQSPKPAEGTPAGLPSMCGMLEEFWAELGIERPHVAGNSMGGMIALELARRGTVASACALSPGGFQSESDTRFIRAQLNASYAGARRIAPYAGTITKTSVGRALLMSGVVHHPGRIPADEAALAVRGMAECTWFRPNLDWLGDNAFRDVTHTSMPVTIAWGTHDRLLRPKLAARALALFPDARYVKLPDCGHVPTYDDPELVARVMLDAAAAATD